jgi:hypothetical protein
MKNDPLFKVLAVAVLAGVIVAFASPARTVPAGNDLTAAEAMALAE